MRKWLLLGTFVVLLATVLLVAGEVMEQPVQDAEEILGAALDKLGVTRSEALLTWLEMEEEMSDELPSIVWIGRRARHVFHSNPLCGNIHGPVAYELTSAEEMGYRPCSRCWDIINEETPL